MVTVLLASLNTGAAARLSVVLIFGWLPTGEAYNGRKSRYWN